VAVTIRLLETIARIARHTRNSKDRATLVHHAGMIKRGSREGVSEECDRSLIQERYQAAVKALSSDESKGILLHRQDHF
jgi:uncharacterized membrane protein